MINEKLIDRLFVLCKLRLKVDTQLSIYIGEYGIFVNPKNKNDNLYNTYKFIDSNHNLSNSRDIFYYDTPDKIIKNIFDFKLKT